MLDLVIGTYADVAILDVQTHVISQIMCNLTSLLVKVDRQMHEMRGCDKDKHSLGMLTASQNEVAVTHHAKFLLVLRVQVLHLNTQLRTSLFASQCSVAFMV